MKFIEDRGQIMHVARSFRDEACGRVLDSLKRTDSRSRKVREKRITVVKTRSNECMHKSLSGRRRQKVRDASNFP